MKDPVLVSVAGSTGLIPARARRDRSSCFIALVEAMAFREDGHLARLNLRWFRGDGHLARLNLRSRCFAALVIAMVLGSAGPLAAQPTTAQSTMAPMGPYSNYNWNIYPGPIYYNPGYAQYGLPGVGVSPFDPIVQAQLNLGMRTAQYNMYSAWADWANASANLYYQQAQAQAIANERQLEAMTPSYDVRTRAPRPVAPSQSTSAKLLPRNNVLANDGEVIWPPKIPSSKTLDMSRAAAEAAIRVAVKEFTADGKASIHSVAEAKSQLFAYGEPALRQLVRTNRDEAEKLLKFLASLERVLDTLAGE